MTRRPLRPLPEQIAEHVAAPDAPGVPGRPHTLERFDDACEQLQVPAGSRRLDLFFQLPEQMQADLWRTLAEGSNAPDGVA